MTSKQRFLAVVFFISGFSGLAYQVIWTRMAFACFGIITPVLSVVLSVYMLGLAVGSWAGGRWIGSLVKRSGKSALYFYGAAEGIIGLGAFIAPILLKAGAHVLLGLGQMNSGPYLLASAVALTAAVLPWCFFMGTTFPFMMAYVREEAGAEEESFSFLYTANVLGAMAGCLLTAIALIEALGFNHALWVAAGGNFIIAAGCFLTATEEARARGAELNQHAPAVAAAAAPSLPSSRVTSRGIEWILFTTGFISMAMEVVWTRAFCPVLKTQVYSFALIVFTYLGATFAGSRWYRRDLRRGKVFSTAALLGWLVGAGFLPIVANDPRFAPPQIIGIRFPSAAILLAAIFPFCALLGYITPSLIDERSRGNPRQAGRAYGLNILGCILGPLFASYVLLPWVRESTALLVLGALVVPIFLLNLPSLDPRLRLATSLSAAVVAAWALFFAVDFESYVRRYDSHMEARRDFAASVIAYGHTRDGKTILVNGVGMTVLTPITKIMVHLPLALHRGPASSALIICFGMGTSFRSALSWDLDTTAVELVPSVPKEFGFFHADAAEALRNPKGRIVIDDGRRFLERTRDSFDLIVIDPPPPVEAAGSSLLYSTGFYEAAKPHLRKNGILETWYPSGDALTAVAISRSLRESFPYVRCYRGMMGWGIHFVASMEPIDDLTPQQAAARLPAGATKDLLEWSPISNAAVYLAPVINNQFHLLDLAKTDPRIAITDDRPFNEYFLLRDWRVLEY